MKKLMFISVLSILTLSSCICTKYAAAEDEGALRWNAGDWNAGGKFAYNSSTQGDIKDSEIKLAPRLGTFVSDNLELGVESRFSTSKSESGSFEDKWNSVSVGPYLRYIYCDEYRLLPYVDFGVNYLSNNYKTADYKQTGLDVSAGLGVDYFVNEWLVLGVGYTGVSYQNLNDSRDGVDDISSLNAKFNTNRLNFGLKARF
ncbi:porin family protein [Seonamhaeicola sp. MEBiC1930]|uniref:outer membrane beta-barrel protein n=1 Tax=Seonamhaeicola sp. MEBiC01930 TaxID=2976768 RepID=UPI00324C8065